jgi:hypothetical protein
MRWAWLAAAVAWAAPPVIRFEDVAERAGVRFVLDHHPTPEKHMIETMAGGMAAFDYDGDGRMDLFFTNGAAIPSMEKTSERYANRLYRNAGDWKFRDVTAEAGLAGAGYSMGAAAADFDGDGDVDLFVAGVYRNLLYRNVGNGKFEEISAKAGIKSDSWSVTGGWFDYDNDGRLDLLVVNYSNWSAKNPRYCGDQARGLRVYCHPKYFAPVANQLYRNRGDGTFEDVTVRSGLGAHKGRGMGVAFADYDEDGHLDAFVTNDNLPNFLYRNLGNGKFEETALVAGCALLDHGKPVASMGTDFRDYDNDGRPDIVLTALAGETFPVFRNEGMGMFRDATYKSRIGPLAARSSGWGVHWADLNNDGWKDLFTAQSHVNDLVEKVEAFAYKEANGVFANLGDGTFRADSATFPLKRAHRGSAVADFDGDGRLDVAVSALGEPAELWRNITEGAGNWIAVRAPLGARVVAGNQVQLATSAAGYSSSSLTPVHFGLGGAKTAGRVVVRYGGKEQVFTNAAAGTVLGWAP